QEIRKISPPVDQTVIIGNTARVPRIIHTGKRVRRIRTGGTPAGDQVEVRWLAPAKLRLEHVLFKDEIVGVCPVIWGSPPIVKAHHLGRTRGMLATINTEKPVHEAAVNVLHGILKLVGAAQVEVHVCVIGSHTVASCGIRYAGVGWGTIYVRIGAEIRI